MFEFSRPVMFKDKMEQSTWVSWFHQILIRRKRFYHIWAYYILLGFQSPYCLESVLTSYAKLFSPPRDGREFQYRMIPSEGWIRRLATASIYGQELWKNYDPEILRPVCQPEVLDMIYRTRGHLFERDESEAHSFTDIRDSRLSETRDRKNRRGLERILWNCNGTDTRVCAMSIIYCDASWVFWRADFHADHARGPSKPPWRCKKVIQKAAGRKSLCQNWDRINTG